MTLPIPFTPTPHDGNASPADAFDSYGDVANTTTANFEKINQYFRAYLPVVAVTNQTATAVTYAAGAWTDFPSASWPPLTIVMPMRPTGLVIGIGAMVEMRQDWFYLHVSCRLSGATTWPTGDESLRAVTKQGGMVGAGRITTIPGNYFTPGGTVTITPRYWVDSDGSVPASCINRGGHLWAAALV